VKRLLLLVVTLLLPACGMSPPATEGTDAEPPLDAQEAADLIRNHPLFRRDYTVDVYSDMLSPTAELLVDAGYLETVGRGKSKVRLTELGHSDAIRVAEFEVGLPIFVVNVAQRELLEVTAIREGQQLASTQQIDFTYRRQPSEVGAALLESGSRLDALQPDSLHRGQAVVARHEDGWKVYRVDL
jgi:hypothetical protein